MILFLDFDGVLHPFSRIGGTLVLLPHFERVMRHFDEVDIVISSTWRHDHTLDELRAYFSLDVRQRIIDVTPILRNADHPYLREAEIAMWRSKTERTCEPWLALDDIPWFFSPGCRNLILVDAETGFNERTERELRQRLTQPQPASQGWSICFTPPYSPSK